MNLRPYQTQVVDAVEAGWENARTQLAVLPTGAGKTIIFAHIASRQPGRTLILAHREELIEQAADKIFRATGIRAEIEKAERRASLSAQVVVGSIQSLLSEARRSEWPANHFNLIVCDEAHHSISPSWQTVLQHFPAARVLGVTATPDRGDKRNLGEFYEAIAAEVQLIDLIRDGYLSPITIKSVPLKIDLSAVKSTAGDLDSGELGSALEPYLGAIAGAIREHASFRRVLAFLPLIATSEKFTAACKAVGLAAEHIDGYSPDRADRLARFAAGEFDVLSNAMLLTEGYDCAGIDCVLVLRPTRSRALYSQMIGRGTRIDPLKENLLLLDFLWMHERHSVTRPAHLIAKTEDEAEAITKLAEERSAGGATQEELDLDDLATEATHVREESLRNRLKEQSDRKAKFISAEDFALRHDSLAVAEFEPVMKWESREITPGQLKMIKRAKINPDTVRGRGHASKLIDLYIRGQSLTLASPGQRKVMSRMGHPNADTATADDARRFFAELKRRAA
jgi:superfamily II DNA or RNA helicase